MGVVCKDVWKRMCVGGGEGGGSRTSAAGEGGGSWGFRKRTVGVVGVGREVVRAPALPACESDAVVVVVGGPVWG